MQFLEGVRGCAHAWRREHRTPRPRGRAACHTLAPLRVREVGHAKGKCSRRSSLQWHAHLLLAFGGNAPQPASTTTTREENGAEKKPGRAVRPVEGTYAKRRGSAGAAPACPANRPAARRDREQVLACAGCAVRNDCDAAGVVTEANVLVHHFAHKVRAAVPLKHAHHLGAARNQQHRTQHAQLRHARRGSGEGQAGRTWFHLGFRVLGITLVALLSAPRVTMQYGSDSAATRRGEQRVTRDLHACQD